MAEMLTTKSGTKINFHTRIGSLDYKKLHFNTYFLIPLEMYYLRMYLNITHDKIGVVTLINVMAASASLKFNILKTSMPHRL